METLDDKIIVKNALGTLRFGQPRGYELNIVTSDQKRSDDVVTAYYNKLIEEFGSKGEDIHIAIMEAIINYFQHANGFDPEKRVEIRTWRDDTRFYFSIGAEEGKGFDPRDVCLTPEARNEKLGTILGRGRGHALMNYYADYIQYDANGKSMLMVFDLSKKAA